MYPSHTVAVLACLRANLTFTEFQKLTVNVRLHVHCISWSSRYLPRGISWWPWWEHTDSRNSGGSSRHSFHHSASPGGSWARKWHPSFSAPHARRPKSCVECSCTAEPPPSRDWDQFLLKKKQRRQNDHNHFLLKRETSMQSNCNVQVENVLPLGFLLRMKDFPSTCHVGLYNSSISTCHRSGSRYCMTSSMVLSPATASDNSSIPCRDGGRTAGTSGSDTLCGETSMTRWRETGKKGHLFMKYNKKCNRC